jgi:hypothetical protein
MNKASLECLWTIDSKNTIFRLAPIHVSSTGAFECNRTYYSKQHNINFHLFFDYTAGKPPFYLHARPSDARVRHRKKDYGP